MVTSNKNCIELKTPGSYADPGVFLPWQITISIKWVIINQLSSFNENANIFTYICLRYVRGDSHKIRIDI